ncbi:Panacea domain-containing protein [Thalassobacillus sp. CUG 92003]|uniref:Panacea domain-containing protein n=1 Tax=Thalassobacillus sp. CUG 92003 TaxID=2736641 RepID=UPI0015E65560|nr:type II toxin-antitoxin system antitoxin SocA domain-containing protein [Thalassobacillus sp. CUG 92003]
MQKLVFYAHAYHLAVTDKPLVKEKFYAAIHGPYCKELFDYYRSYGFDSIQKPLTSSEVRKFPDERTKDILKLVWKLYGHMNHRKIENIVKEEHPWRYARGLVIGNRTGNAHIDKQIRNHDIKDYYVRSLLQILRRVKHADN